MNQDLNINPRKGFIAQKVVEQPDLPLDQSIFLRKSIRVPITLHSHKPNGLFSLDESFIHSLLGLTLEAWASEG